MARLRQLEEYRRSYVPRNGWNNAEFVTRNGYWLVRDIVNNQRTVVAYGIATYSAYLRVAFRQVLEDIITKVEEQKKRLGQVKSTEFTFNPDSDENLWLHAINDVMSEFNGVLVVQTFPAIQRTITEVFSRTTVVLGTDNVPRDITARIDRAAGEIAQQVTRVNETTRERLAARVIESVNSGESVSDTARRMRREFPQIAANRVATIARTEMGRAADKGNAMAMQASGVIGTVSVVGCNAIEKGIPTYMGIPTCNIQDVPIRDADQLDFHINHTGCIVPNTFFGVGADVLDELDGELPHEGNG